MTDFSQEGKGYNCLLDCYPETNTALLLGGGSPFKSGCPPSPASLLDVYLHPSPVTAFNRPFDRDESGQVQNFLKS